MPEQWISRFRRVAAIDPQHPAPPPHREMSETVFQALLEGRLAEVEDELEDLDDNPWAQSLPLTFSEAPVRAVALAAVCKALPTAEHSAELTRPGEITLIRCRPAGLASEVGWALKRLLLSDNPEGKFDVTVSVQGDQARGSAPCMIERCLENTLVTRTAQILVSCDAGIASRFADLLPAPVSVGPPDRDVIAAALSVSTGQWCEAADLPDESALRALGLDGLRLALRFETLDQTIAELRRVATKVSARTSSVTLDHVAGYGEAEEVGRRLVSDLHAWALGEVRWEDMTRSVLFHGEPGTGKTFLARAIAGSAGLPLITGSFASWQSAGHLGHMLREMRRTFDEAREAAPCLLFVDEIDAAGDRGSKDLHAENYRRQVINGFLELMDGAVGRAGVAVIAACNDIGALDPAILRPGRIDRFVQVPRPGRAAVDRILTYHAGGLLGPEEIRSIARLATGRTAAELDGAVREAKGIARALRRPLSAGDVAAALGFEDEDPELLWRVAVHEAGHAIAAVRLRRGRISAISIGISGGHVRLSPPARIVTAKDMREHISFLLAGRAAEELVLGEASIGAGGGPESDLALATEMALRLELAFGLTDHALIYHPDPVFISERDPAVRNRANLRLREGMQRATDLLREEETLLRQVAKVIYRERVLEGDPDEPDLGARLMALSHPENEKQV